MKVCYPVIMLSYTDILILEVLIASYRYRRAMRIHLYICMQLFPNISAQNIHLAIAIHLHNYYNHDLTLKNVAIAIDYSYSY